MSDPKTAAFAKAAQAIPEEAITGLLSDDDDLEDEDEQAAMTTQSESIKPKLIIREDDEDEEDEDIMDINSVDEEDEPVVVSTHNVGLEIIDLTKKSEIL